MYTPEEIQTLFAATRAGISHSAVDLSRAAQWIMEVEQDTSFCDTCGPDPIEYSIKAKVPMKSGTDVYVLVATGTEYYNDLADLVNELVDFARSID